MKLIDIAVEWEGGIEFHVADKGVKWAINGIWHHMTVEQFKSMLRKHGKPKKQKIDSR